MQALLTIFKEKSPTQLKRFQSVADELGQEYLHDVELFFEKHIPYWESIGMSFQAVVDAYLNMCDQYMYYQIRFYKSGKYPFHKDPEGTLKKMYDLYADPHTMKVYMAGLSMSLVMWKSHYLMLSFFRDELKKHANTIKSYLEVGVGHGIHFGEACHILGHRTQKTALDISPVSLQMTASLMGFFQPDATYKTEKVDFLELNTDHHTYDFITMGEVVEHVDKPGIFFQKAVSLLRPGGKLFFSTCVNCPMIDHLYHFQSLDQIRSMAAAAGLVIDSEMIVAAENLPIEEIVRQKITLNFAAIAHKL